MKKIITFIITIVSLSNILAQEDSVNMTGGYALDVFYSLEDGAVQTVANNEWTVALSTTATSSQVLLNDGRGAELYKLANNISDFTSINASDTNGMQSWTALHNNFENWEQSAFESGATGHPNYGWGNYTGSPLHNLLGDKVFILKTLNNVYYKVMPVLQSHGEWTYRYATLNNSFDTTIVYQASDLQDRNFVYLNMDNHTVLNREPSNTDWDLLFTKYFSINADYSVMGILSNKGVEVLQIDGVNHPDATHVNGTFSEATNEIGYDWKEFNGTSFDLIVDRTYFVKQLTGEIYKMYFTRFDGSSTGKTVFNKELVGVSRINDNNEILKAISIFPNPAKSFAHIIFDSNSKISIDITIYNIVGKTISTQKADITSGLNDIKLDVNNLHKGIYLVKIQYGNNTQTLKLNVSK